MTRTRKFLGGIGFGYLNQAVFMLIGLWLTPFLLRRLGAHDYGLWLVATQVMFYLGLLDLGVVALLPRETAFITGRRIAPAELPDNEPINIEFVAAETEATDAKSDNAVTSAATPTQANFSPTETEAELAQLLGETLNIALWQTPLVALGAGAAWLLLPNEWATLRFPLAIVFALFVALFPLRIFNAALQGLQDLVYVGRINLITYLLGAAVTVGLIFYGFGLYALACGWAAQQFVLTLLSWTRMRAMFSGALPARLPQLLWSRVRQRFGQGIWVSVSQIATVLLTGTDVLLIGKLLGAEAVVVYACTGKLISVLSNQPTMIMHAAAPALSQLRVSESRERILQVCVALTQGLLLLSGLIVCVALAINGAFIGLWVGAAQYGGLGLTLVLLLSMLLRHWNITLVYTIFCFGYERYISLITLTDGIITTLLTAFFVWRWGIIGAPLGSLLGVCLVSLPRNLQVLAREIKTTPRAFVQPLATWAMRCGGLLLAIWYGLRWFAGRGFVWFIIAAGVVTLAYLLLMLPLLRRAPLGEYILPRLRGWRAWRQTRETDAGYGARSQPNLSAMK